MVLDKFQFVELFRSNDTERVRAVAERTAPGTHRQRWLAARSKSIQLIKPAPVTGAGLLLFMDFSASGQSYLT